jgi:hypothetical protein
MEIKEKRIFTYFDLVEKYFPLVSKEEANSLLWEKTAFPFDSSVIEEQLKKYTEACKNGKNICYKCGDFCDKEKDFCNVDCIKK